MQDNNASLNNLRPPAVSESEHLLSGVLVSLEVHVVGPAGIGVWCVDGAGRSGFGAREGHVVVRGVPGVRDAARAALGARQAGHLQAPGRRVLPVTELRAHDLVDRPLPPVLAPAAAADPNKHDNPRKDLEDTPDVAQDDAVAHPHVVGHAGRRDIFQDVRVPRDGDEGHDARQEDQQPAQAGQGPAGGLTPATDPWDGDGKADEGDDERRHHQPLGHLDDLLVEVLRILQPAAQLAGVRGPADVPDALLDELIRRGVPYIDRAPVGGHRGDEVQDPAARGQDHPEDKDPRGPQRGADPFLRRHGGAGGGGVVVPMWTC